MPRRGIETGPGIGPRLEPDHGRRTSRAGRFAGALLAAGVVLAGCTAPEPVTPAVTGDYTELSLPTGTQIIPPAGIAPAEPPAPSTCGALASLRPAPPVPTGARPPGRLVADILERGRLIVGVGQDTNLFSFRDPTTDTITGFDVDVAREVARDLLGDPDKIEFRPLTPAGRFDALEKNEVDIVAQTTTITCERAERVAFSTVYLEAHQRLLVPEGSAVSGPADLAGARVCAAADTTPLDTIRRIQPQATIVAVPDLADCLVVLQQRQADRRQQRRHHPRGPRRPGPHPRHRRSTTGTRALRHRHQQDQHRPGAPSQRHPRTDAHGRDVDDPLPTMADRTRPAPRSARPHLPGLKSPPFRSGNTAADEDTAPLRNAARPTAASTVGRVVGPP